MRVLLLAPASIDHVALRGALGPALGATSVDICHTAEAAVTWLENRPCDLVGVAGSGVAVAEAVERLRRASPTLPLLAFLDDPGSRDAGAAWLAGADDVVALAGVSGGTAVEGLDEVRRQDRDALRRTQHVWYAGAQDGLRQQLAARLGQRLRDVGLTGEGLAGLTTQDVEAPQAAALVVNARAEPAALVLGVRRVKRTYPALAITVIAEPASHDAFRRAGADECLGAAPDADHLLHALGRAQSACRGAAELDAVRARETRLRALLEHLPEAVVLVSPDHATLAVNLAALRLLGAQDARQVLGSALEPWLEAEDGDPTAMAALVDTVAGGATRDVVLRTRHLADPRRIHVRAVPFQRESDGQPAALLVLRDVAGMALGAPAGDPADAEALEAERRSWGAERTATANRLQALDDELAAARRGGERVAALEIELAATQSRLADTTAALGEARAIAARVGPLQHALHLAETSASDAAHLRERVRVLERMEAEDLPALHALVAQLRAREMTPDMTREFDETRERLAHADTRAHELELGVAALERDNAALRDTLGGLRSPGTDASAILADAMTGDATLTDHHWLLEHVARVGVVVTDREGRIAATNARAAQLCGFESAAAFRAAGSLPEPLLAASGGDMVVSSRFELCLQVGPESTPVWVAGARLPVADGEAAATWWLAEANDRQPPTRAHERPEAMSAVLEIATAECAALVASVGGRSRDPRPTAARSAARR